MDDDLQQLEAELKSLRPIRPSRVLETRIASELASSTATAAAAPTPKPRKRPLASIHWLWSAALPVAAAIAILAVLPGKRASRGGPRIDSNPAATLKPVAAENVLYAVQDEGLVTLEDGTPARRERLNYVDTITWKNPRTNASLTWSVPREEVRVVPVSYQ